MLRLAALLLLAPLAASAPASAQAPPALAHLAPRPLAGPTDDPYCLAQPGQVPGVVHVLFGRRIPVAQAREIVAAGSGVAVREPRPELTTVYFLNVEVPVGFETPWCERLSARPGVYAASRLGPTAWMPYTVVVGHSPHPWPGSVDWRDVARVRERFEAAWQ